MKGICPACHKNRWLGGKGRRCKPCAYPTALCTKCSKQSKIYARGLCYTCYEDELVRKKLDDIESNFSTDHKYNRYLFTLYLQYTRRFKLHYFHVKQTNIVAAVLRLSEISPILSWMPIYKLEAKYPTVSRRRCGRYYKRHAFCRIGYRLQEMGVLPPRHDEQGRQLQNCLESFDAKALHYLIPFVEYLRSSKHAESTIVLYLGKLRDLVLWAKANHSDCTLLDINRNLFTQYLRYIVDKQMKPHFIWAIRTKLNYFYHFCKLNSLILANPCDSIPLSKLQGRICIVSETDYKKLCTFIQNPQTNPEEALLLALILFFGLTTSDLMHSQICLEGALLSITLRRPKRTRGKRFYNRDQVLKLPVQPIWLFELQNKFYKQWKEHRSKIKSPSPYAPLFLPHNYQHNRPLSDTIMQRRVNSATRTATGQSIPTRILRQTCGHIYSMGNDASMLSRLGWSTQFAFHYTWLPRTYYKSTQT